MIEYTVNKISNLIAFFRLDEFQFIDFFTLLSVTVAAFIIEGLIVGWKSSSFKKFISFRKSTRNDFIIWLIAAFNLYSIIGFFLTLGTCLFLVIQVEKYFSIDFHLDLGNNYLTFALLFIISDFKNYIRHYFFHRSGIFWQLHKYHHSAPDMNILARQRGHFVETEFSRFFDILPVILFDAPIYSYFLIAAISELHQQLLHSEIKSDWGFIGKYLLVSPAAHRVHHSIEREHYDKNMGSTFIFWDRLFGTYHPSVHIEQIGIRESEFDRNSFASDIFRIMKDFIKEIGRKSGIIKK